jgi:hypothetical protein
MNLQEKLKHARSERAKLEDEIHRLEKEIEATKPKHGDVVMAMEGQTRLVVYSPGDIKFIAVGQPNLRESYGQEGFSGAGKDDVERLYRNGFYKVIGNIFDGYRWPESSEGAAWYGKL